MAFPINKDGRILLASEDRAHLKEAVAAELEPKGEVQVARSLTNEGDADDGGLQSPASIMEAHDRDAHANGENSPLALLQELMALHEHVHGKDESHRHVQELQALTKHFVDKHLEKLDSVVVGQPDAPPPPVDLPKEKPKGMGAKAWEKLMKVREVLKPLRGGLGNYAVSLAALGMGSDSCLLKLLYVFYVDAEEDDYPYFPNGCAGSFESMIMADARRWATPSMATLLLGVLSLLYSM
eukprot:gnl/TRDRNA2_/TRDRNA2_43362_c0_seq1.p2 gnl/TRDRNA2_/TRDRNA2_43362_c0~~gnl/TRDRNA2_/TRDRNA2_43362_c0_seq1.p2  ORF type:complete len:239 (+),score=62.33 gnl/TRDRNA2_/TRDRNA2_43362_c0_seq1:3-719(+)